MYGYSAALHQSWETEWIPESQLSTSLNTQGIPHIYESQAVGLLLSKFLVVKLF